MPADLLMAINAESEEWARDSVRNRLHELYDEARDWNTVRRMFRGA